MGYLRSFQLFFALAVPLDDPASTMSVALFLEAEYKLPSDVTEIELANGDRKGKVKRNTDRRRTIDRGTIYAMLESKFESSVTCDKASAFYFRHYFLPKFIVNNLFSYSFL